MEYIKTFEDFLFEKNLNNLFELNESNAYLMNEEDAEARKNEISAELKKVKQQQDEFISKEKEIMAAFAKKTGYEGNPGWIPTKNFDEETQAELKKIRDVIYPLATQRENLEDELRSLRATGSNKAFFNKVKEIKRDLSEEGISFRIPNVEKYYKGVAQKDKEVIAEIKKLIIDNNKKLKEWKKKHKGESDEKGRDLFDEGYTADFKIKLFTLIGQQKQKEILKFLEDVYDDFQ